MNQSLRIAVADDEPRMLEFYKEILTVLGHTVVCTARNGKELIEGCKSAQPDLIIADIKMPDMDGIQATQEIYRHTPIPVVLVSAYDSPEFLERADFALGYLVKPIKQQDLQPALIIAMRRFREFQSLQKEATDLRQALQDRKVIERAKGIIMKRLGIDEEAAFRSLQKMARDKNRKLAQIAEMILTAEEVFQQSDSK